MIRRINKSCKYFPCHKDLEDCTFCYCPFYPCGNEWLGRYVFSKRLNRRIWSCMDCNWIHKKKVVDRIFDFIRRSDINPKGAKKRESIHRSPSKIKTGIIIIAHGSKLKKANQRVYEIIDMIKNRVAADFIEPSFLQSCQPDLSRSIKKIVEKECKKIIIFPLFLFMGNHVSRDIPKAIEIERKKYPDVDFVYIKNLGQDVRIHEIILDIIREAISDDNC